MPSVTVFTPSHTARYLDECWASLEAQTYDDFEWIVVLNGEAQWEPPEDSRIVVFTEPHLSGNVGALKRLACDAAQGDILVELDHDDILTVNCLEEIVKAFSANPDASLVYSDCAQMNEDASPNDDRFAEGHGWTYREEEVRWLYEALPASIEDDLLFIAGLGPKYTVIESKPPTPHNVSYIWYAPNHVRAFDRSAYEAAGGHDPDLEVCDDHDLMCRLYQVGPFVHIPQLLYLQRVHGDNTQKDSERNAQIQAKTVELYDRWVQANALTWARREGLEAWDLGGAHNSPEVYEPIDKALSGEDIFVTLGNTPDDSIGVIRAVDFLEHVEDQIGLMNELYRVLAPGGMLLSLTPSTDGRGAFCDPTHRSWWNELSFRYYCEGPYLAYVPEVTARFRCSRLVTYMEGELPYVCANLTKD